jgi:hypothetical protein
MSMKQTYTRIALALCAFWSLVGLIVWGAFK